MNKYTFFFFGLFAWTGRLHSCSQADVSSTHHNHVNLPRFITTTKPLQSCLTLCDPIDGNPPGSSVPGTLQARTLEWVAISFSTPRFSHMLTIIVLQGTG